jgi:hypothetical protein
VKLFVTSKLRNYLTDCFQIWTQCSIRIRAFPNLPIIHLSHVTQVKTWNMFVAQGHMSVLPLQTTAICWRYKQLRACLKTRAICWACKQHMIWYIQYQYVSVLTTNDPFTSSKFQTSRLHSILDINTLCRWWVSLISQPVHCLGNNPKHQLSRGMGGPPEPVWLLQNTNKILWA